MILKIHLSNKEFKGLKGLATSEYRNTSAQAAIIIRRELERLGLLAADELSLDIDPSEIERGETHES